MDEALRAAGRLVAFAAAAAVLFFIIGVMLKPLLPDGLPMGRDGALLYAILVAVALGLAHLAMVATLERGSWRATGLGERAWSPLAMLLGLALGALVQGLAPLAFRLAGIAAPGAAAWAWPDGDLLTLLGLTALVQTLMLRGYAIGAIAARAGNVAAVALTALVATLLHLLRESAEPVGLAEAFALASLFGAVRLRTGSLVAAWLAQVAGAVVAEGGGLPEARVATAVVALVVTFLLLLIARPRSAVPGRT